MELIIREALVDDLPKLLVLLQQLDVGNDMELSAAEAQRIFERTKTYPDYHLYVAEIDARMVGTFVLILIDSIAHGGAPHGLVEDVVVAPESQGQGIGKRMMLFAMDRCRAAGCYKMALSSHLQRDKTHAFYESLGFKKHGFSFLVQPKDFEPHKPGAVDA